MKSRMYVMYVTKIRKERFQVYPTIIKVMGSTRYTRFPPRLTIDALRCTLHEKYSKQSIKESRVGYTIEFPKPYFDREELQV